MERVRFFVVPLVAVLVMGWAARPAMAQTKEARGSVVTVSDSSLTVKVADKDMRFTVDDKTVVEAPGAGRATRDAQGKGAPGIKLTSVVKPGSGVIVTYREAGGAMIATDIRSVPAAAAAAGGGASTTTANGRVKSVTAASLVVTDNGKDLTFVVDKDTRVLAKGAGTATTAAGGSIAFTKLVAVGDTVSVSYAGAGPAMRATEVRITVNANRAPTPAGR